MSDWAPSASLDMLRNRARMLHGIRAFFDVRGVMEVSPPLLSAAAVTDPQIESVQARVCGKAERLSPVAPRASIRPPCGVRWRGVEKFVACWRTVWKRPP